MNVYEFATTLVLNLLFPYTRGNVKSLEAKRVKEFVNKHIKVPKFAPRCVLSRDVATKSLIFRSPIYASGNLDNVKPFSDLVLVESLPKSTSLDEKIKVVDSIKTFEDTPFRGTRVMPIGEILPLLDMPETTKAILKNCLVSIESVRDSNNSQLWATWRINQKEAEYLNNSPFLGIKISNFYGPLVDWATSCFGRDIYLPETISSVITVTSDVKQILGTTTAIKPRVGIDNVIVDINHRYYILPNEDRAAEYEQRLMDFGLQEDGTYTWNQSASVNDAGDIEFDIGSVSKKKLPSNLPVFTDWLNDKFVYSSTTGALAIFDLSTTVPVKAFHVQKLLNLPFNSESGNDAAVSILVTSINNAASFNQSLLAERPTADEMGISDEEIDKHFRGVTNFQGLVAKALELHAKVFGDMLDFYVVGKTYTPYLYQLDAQTGVPSLRFLGRIVDKALKLVVDNTEVLYGRLSVLTVTQAIAVLTLVSKYAKDRDAIVELDKQERDAYISQAPDPDYQVEELPNLRKDFKYLPHQFKVQNMMRKGPAFAIWGVDAGGGKTPITITNTLNELQNKRCSRPLVLCPHHLISNYVKEIVYVTEGKVNAIPVTNSTFKIHGEDALRKMIENAPPNTIVLSDFLFIKNRQDTVAYGNKSIQVYRNAEFLRQFQFDMVVIDESHYLKNLKSGRRNAAAKLIHDIPMKRLASGTFVADTVKDIVSQVALIDPTIFGSTSKFIGEFAAETKGDKVLAWLPDAERKMRERINEHCVFATAKRKEWAALLPPANERFIGVELTDNQRILYESILQETMDLIREALAKNPELKEAMESEDDTKADELEALLRPYMARLERFLSAPDSDPAAQSFLKSPEDLISPKAQKIYEICREHVSKKIPGKVLIFTQYTASAASVYENAPPDLKKHFIHYVADNKTEARAEYENNDSMIFMVGVSSSMDTGLNFQHVSRLIRMETVWTPGVLEQGNSRINRPQVKKLDIRPEIYFDWLVVNRSVDITKVARLISKIISKSKFDEFDNLAYQNQEDLPQVPITLESIAANNDFQADLEPYLLGYQTYSSIVKADYEQYRLDNPDKLEPVPVPSAGLLPDSKLMSRVPYVPEMEIYGTDNLGLIRYDQFMRQDIAELDDDDSDSGSDKEEGEDEDETVDTLDPKQAAKRAALEARRKERAIVRNRPVHTEFGDGVITGIGPRKVRVRLADGRLIRLFKMQVFMITRSTTNNIDMRNELLKQVGKIPLDAPITVPVEEGVQDKRRKRKARGEQVEVKVETPTQPQAAFDFTIMNDHLGIMFQGDSSEPEVINALQNFGFRISPEYTFCKMPGPRTLLALFKAWSAKGFTIDKDTSTTFKRIYEALRANKTALSIFGFSSKLALQNFYREQIKPSADPKLIKVYPMIQDGILYVMLPKKGQAGNQKASRITVPGVRWKHGGGEDEVIKFVSTKAEAKDTLKDIISSGIQVTNLDELGDQFKKLKIVTRKG